MSAQRGQETILDVRTAEEFATAHVPGAVNIPVQELMSRLTELGSKDTPITIYCRSGARSATATAMLKGAGFSSVTDIGPMSCWRAR